MFRSLSFLFLFFCSFTSTKRVNVIACHTEQGDCIMLTITKRRYFVRKHRRQNSNAHINPVFDCLNGAIRVILNEKWVMSYMCSMFICSLFMFSMRVQCEMFDFNCIQSFGDWNNTRTVLFGGVDDTHCPYYINNNKNNNRSDIHISITVEHWKWHFVHSNQRQINNHFKKCKISERRRRKYENNYQ